MHGTKNLHMRVLVHMRAETTAGTLSYQKGCLALKSDMAEENLLSASVSLLSQTCGQSPRQDPGDLAHRHSSPGRPG